MAKYRSGQRDPAAFFGKEDLLFLSSIGLPPMAAFDYAEDFASGGDPDWETVLLMTSARRDYFLYEQRGELSGQTLDTHELPPREAELGGIA